MAIRKAQDDRPDVSRPSVSAEIHGAISAGCSSARDRLSAAMSDLVVAAVQMTSGEDVEANLERCARAGP